MKFLKRLLILILSVIGLVLIIALFVEQDFHVQRSVSIDRPPREVYDFVKYLKNQDTFSVWNQTDPDMKKSYRGTDGTVGFAYSWESTHKDVGSGSQTIAKLDDGKRVDFNVAFREPFESHARAYFEITPENDASTVVWAFEGSTPYPFNFFSLFMDMEAEVGKDLEAGLQNLKRVLESED